MKGRLFMEFSVWHLMVVAIVILVLFGGRKIPEMMKGLGQGVREFKEGMRGDQPQQQAPSAPVQTQAAQPANPPVVEEKK
jgi:sec-independent protein translocase protein TatA